MKATRVVRVLLVLMVALLSLAPRAAASGVAERATATPAISSKILGQCIHGLESLCLINTSGPRAAALRAQVGPARLPASATAAVVPATCPDTLGGVCGTVAVPLDRDHPASGTINIFFELFTHTSPGPAQSAILVNPGGPGAGTVPGAFIWLFFFGQNLDVHDLLLIDDRGRGLSGTIDCPALQHGRTEPFAQAEADCATQLGPAASRYGTGDIAQDTDAVRAALGYDKVDYVGMSAGGQDVAAYATRFPSHVRSLVQDAPYGPAGLGPFTVPQLRAHSETRIVSVLCGYSPTCSADHPFARAELEWLVNYIRFHPIEGTAYDASGALKQVRIDETYLLWYIFQSPEGDFTSTGELVAAAASLRQGDAAPLLRLGAETYFPSPGGDNGDPTGFSNGAHYATGCADNTVPWNWHAAVPGRQAQYARAVRELPEDYFAPFSKVAGASLVFGQFGAQCLWWQKPTPSSPVVAPGSAYPAVPDLILDGDIDNQVPLEEVSRLAALYPGSMFVPVADSYHTTLFQTSCARTLASSFIETLQTGDTSCARTPELVWPAVGRFPVLAAGAVPATVDPTANNQIGERDRKAVTVAVAAAIDTLERFTAGAIDDHCLRAGSFHIDLPVPTIQNVTLTNCSFSQDVAVNGTLTWGSDSSIVADLTLSGAGTAGGTIHVAGFWIVPGPVGNFKVSGTLGGLNVGVLVPEA